METVLEYDHQIMTQVAKHKELNRQVREFIKRGGKIQQVAQGVTGVKPKNKHHMPSLGTLSNRSRHEDG